MNRETYDYIWTNVIEPNIAELFKMVQQKTNDSSFKQKNIEEVKSEIINRYEVKRDRLKELYHYDNNIQEDKLIDCHKIAACFASVLFDYKVFSYEINPGLTDDVFLANARLAYRVSLGIIYLSLLYHYKKSGNEPIVGQLQSMPQLEVPPTSHGHDEYNLGREKTIVLNDVFNNEFDVLTYSDMMFWIEYYNRQLLEKEITPKPFDFENGLYDA